MKNSNKKSKKKSVSWVKISIGIIVVLIGVFLLYFFSAWVGNLWPFNKSWQAVALTSGEVYFGHLVWLPSPHLVDVWYIRNVSDENNELSQKLFPFSSLYWGPENVLYLSREKIVWWTTLSSTSQVVRLINLARSTLSLPREVPKQTIQNNDSYSQPIRKNQER